MRLFVNNLSIVEYLVLALLPIFGMYSFLPAINLGYFIAMVLIIFYYFPIKQANKINLIILLIMAYLVTINMFVGISKYDDISNSINNTIGIFVFTFIAMNICVPNKVKIERLYKYCKFVSIIATSFLFLQFYLYLSSNVVISGQIPFLTPIDEAFKSIGYGRPNSFFYEPAHYSIYVAPVFAVSLLKREYKTSLFLLMGLILSTSATGIILSFIILCYSLFSQRNKSILLISIPIMMFFYFFVTRYYLYFFEKVSINNLIENIRIIGSFRYFELFRTSEWLFGIGFNRLSEFMSGNGLVVPNFANAYVFSIISFGIVGGVVWVVYTLHLRKVIDKRFTILFIIFLFVLLSDQVLFNRNLLYLLIWIYSASKIKNNLQYNK